MFLERVGGEQAGGEEAFSGLEVADWCALAGFGMHCIYEWTVDNSLSARMEEISGSNSGSMVGSESIVTVCGDGRGGGYRVGCMFGAQGT